MPSRSTQSRNSILFSIVGCLNAFVNIDLSPLLLSTAYTSTMLGYILRIFEAACRRYQIEASSFDITKYFATRLFCSGPTNPYKIIWLSMSCHSFHKGVCFLRELERNIFALVKISFFIQRSRNGQVDSRS